MVTVNIGGKERKFALNTATYRIAEKRHGVVLKGSDIIDPSAGTIAMFLWIGLLASDVNLKEDQVLEWLIAEDNVDELQNFVVEQMEEGRAKGDGDPLTTALSLTGTS